MSTTDIPVELERERNELLDSWRKVLSKEGWRRKIEGKIAKYFKCMSSVDDRSKASKIRGIHDALEYRAMKNGLCRGAIFRTEKFVTTIHRSGTKPHQTVHIEHTIPIAELDRQLRAKFFGQPEAATDFLLKFSVCTAFHMEEKSTGITQRYSSKSDAFDDDHADFERPFQRYRPLFAKPSVIWNVFDKVKVDPNTFDFDQHGEIVQRLIAHCS